MIEVTRLHVGDTLVTPERDLLITHLIPATAEEAVAYGAREVISGSASWTYDVGQMVNAIPRERYGAVARG